MTNPDAEVDNPAAAPATSANASNRRLARNGLLGWVNLAATMVLGIVVTPTLLSRLGEVNFGLWALALSLVGYVGMVELGVGTATITRTAAIEGLGDRGRLQDVLSSALVLYARLAVAALLGVSALCVAFPYLVDVPADRVTDVRWALALLGAWQIISFFVNVASAAIIGSGRTDLTVLPGLLLNVVTSLSQVTIVVLGYGIVGLGVVTVVSGAMSVLVQWTLLRRLHPDISVRPRHASRLTRRHLMGLALRNALVQISGTLAYGADAVIVGILLGPTKTAAYAVAARASTFLYMVARRAIDVVVPAYGHAWSRGDLRRVRELYVSLVILSSGLVLPGVVMLVAQPQGILDLWLGSVPQGADEVLRWLALGLVFLTGYNGFLLLMGTERVRALGRVAAVSCLINITLSVLFTVTWGVAGPAIGSLVAIVFIEGVALPWLVARQLGEPFRKLMWSLFRPMLPAYAMAVLAGWIVHLLPSSAMWLLISTLTTAFLVYGACWFSMPPPLRRRVVAMSPFSRG